MDALVASLGRMGFSERQGRHAVRAVERRCGIICVCCVGSVCVGLCVWMWMDGWVGGWGFSARREGRGAGMGGWCVG
jgi:hypothetical protein